jgi:hypothetical protein
VNLGLELGLGSKRWKPKVCQFSYQSQAESSKPEAYTLASWASASVCGFKDCNQRLLLRLVAAKAKIAP